MMKRKGLAVVAIALTVMMMASTALGAYATLRYRAEGEAVVRLQQALNQLGYSTGGTDGKYGPATEKAVRNFQRANGLTVDGVAGNATQTLLYKKAAGGQTSSGTVANNGGNTSAGSKDSLFGGNYNTLEYADKGARVTTLQNALNDLGYACGKADGKFGAGTQRAVTAFQKDQRLTADGKAGKKTLQRIESLLGSTGGSSGGASAATPPPKPTATPTPKPDTSGYDVPTRTLRKGYTGEDVKSVQRRLKELGYYTGSIDGNYGTGTVAAVKNFQSRNKLTADGIAGSGTYKKLYSTSAVAASAAATATPTPKPTATPTPKPTYTAPERTLRSGMEGDDVKEVQKRLKELKYYNKSIDGKYGSGTISAVKAFQTRAGLTADGVCGTNTIKKLFASNAPVASNANSFVDNTDTTTAIPAKSQVKLLHWFNDVKPTIRSGQYVLCVDPTTGMSWTLRLYSLGRHADSEPLTKKDTDTMYKVFGNQNTWNQKAVYVRLPNGTWTIGSTHNMPHLSGSIKDNGFDGHLCLHFLRDMDECSKNDPKYGVANQKTIRSFWKKLTGETVN
ncbi:MAG: peptidoglycan-binding protein [Clostridia bacterium]|nr:peptidoglycan-binding protein [Clostridia bacterium]